MAMDILCQEMRDACWVSSNSENSPLSLFSPCQNSSLLELSQQRNLFSQHGRAVTFEEKDVLGEMVWEWVVKAPTFVTVWTWCAFFRMRVFLLFVCAPPCFVYCSEGRKEASPPFGSFVATIGRWFPWLSMCARAKETPKFFLVRAFRSVGQSDWHWWRLFSSWATKHRLKAFKNQKKKNGVVNTVCWSVGVMDEQGWRNGGYFAHGAAQKDVQKTVVVPQIQYIAVCDATTSFTI